MLQQQRLPSHDIAEEELPLDTLSDYADRLHDAIDDLRQDIAQVTGIICMAGSSSHKRIYAEPQFGALDDVERYTRDLIALARSALRENDELHSKKRRYKRALKAMKAPNNDENGSAEEDEQTNGSSSSNNNEDEARV